MFWNEKDILHYIYDNNIKLCSVYGEVRVNKDGKYYTTGCDRTGCVMCGFGCHLEKENRFQKLAQTHPQMIKLLDILENNGITYRQAIKYCNENIKNFNIDLPNDIDK